MRHVWRLLSGPSSISSALRRRLAMTYMYDYLRPKTMLDNCQLPRASTQSRERHCFLSPTVGTPWGVKAVLVHLETGCCYSEPKQAFLSFV